MTRHIDLEGVLRTWFEEGGDVLPGHVLDRVVDRLGETRQRRHWWQEIRRSVMRGGLRVALAAAASVLVVVVGGGIYLSRPSVGPGASPSSSPTTAPTGAPSPTHAGTPAATVGATPTTSPGPTPTTEFPAAWVVMFLHKVQLSQNPLADMVAMRLDGTDLHTILEASGVLGTAWSRDGTQLLIQPVGSIRIAQVGSEIGPFEDTGFDTGKETACRDRSDGFAFCSDGSFAFSPDGKRLAFLRECFDYEPGCYLLATMDLANGEVTELGVTEETGEHPLNGPSWSPDGSTLAFGRLRDLNRGENGDFPAWDVYFVGSDGSSMRQFDLGGLSAYTAAWSPDGSRLALGSLLFDEAGRSIENIYVVDADGSNLTQLTTDGSSRWPTWTRSGEILFNGDADDYWLMGGDGRNHRLLIDLRLVGSRTGSYRPTGVSFQPLP